MYVVCKNIKMYVVFKLCTYFIIIFEEQLFRLEKIFGEVKTCVYF